MPKYNLLQMVQRVARAINSDEISELHETVEADDIQNILIDCLDEMLGRQDWEFLKDRPYQLLPGTNALSLSVPSDISRIQKIRYRADSEPGDIAQYRTVSYMSASEFLDMMQKHNPAEADSVTVTVNGVPLVGKNNRPPRYWTSFDESTVYFDSYEGTLDPTGVDPAKTAVLASVYPDLAHGDDPTWVAPMPEKLFAQWYQEAVAEASVQLRQFENPRAERRSRRLFISNSRDEPVTGRDEGSASVNYGR